MSLLERLDKTAKEMDWKLLRRRQSFNYDHCTDDLRKLIVDAAKEIRKLNRAKLDSYGVK